MDDMWFFLGNIFVVMKRAVAHMNQSIEESCYISKYSLSLGAYKRMFQVLISCNKPDHIYGRKINTLEWSFMDRYDCYNFPYVNHLELNDDCIIIYFLLLNLYQQGLTCSSGQL